MAEQVYIYSRPKIGEVYSYRFTVVVEDPVYFKPSVFDFVKLNVRRQFPEATRVDITEVALDLAKTELLKRNVDFVLSFGKDIGLTHYDIVNKIKGICSQAKWSAELREVLLLTEPGFPWWLLLVIGGLYIYEKSK